MTRALIALPLILAACGGGGGPSTAINLPVTATVPLIGFAIQSQQSVSGSGAATVYTTSPSIVQVDDSTVPGTTRPQVTLSVDAQAGAVSTATGSNAREVPVEVDASVAGTLFFGADFPTVVNTPGTAEFRDGSYIGLTAAQSPNLQIRADSIFAVHGAAPVNLSQATVVRLTAFDSGTNEGVYGLTAVGVPSDVASLPATSVTFRGGIDMSGSVYESGTGQPARAMFVRQVGGTLAPAFDIVANFGTGTVGGTVTGIELVGTDPADPNNTILLSQTIDGLRIEGTISGNRITGGDISFVNATNGQVIQSVVEGGFFGDGGAEVAMGGLSEGSFIGELGTTRYIVMVGAGGKAQ